ncbi:J domain-containing protein [Sorangium sp. So ce117]|uniref:J domain-containing protein n=1 Tax=Sorangium sp. So ce117 TaxID=3133277 RepID=UPI003F64176F
MDSKRKRTVRSRNPYRVLGVSETATDAELKERFRRLAKECHPDKNGGDAASNERMAKINAAYDELRDPARRAAVDERLRAERAKRNAARIAKKTPCRPEPPPSDRARVNSIVKAPESAVQAQRSVSGWEAFLKVVAIGGAIYGVARAAGRVGTYYDPSVDRRRGRDGRFRT